MPNPLLDNAIEGQNKYLFHYLVWTAVHFTVDIASIIVAAIVAKVALAGTATRLKRMDSMVQQRLVNWGYAVCDAAMRKHVVSTATAPTRFPYDSSAVG